MAADDLVTYVTRASAAMALTTLDKQVLVFHEDKFQAPAPFQYQEMRENAYIIFGFWKQSRT